MADFSGLIRSPLFIEMLEREAERMRARGEEWRRMFPEREPPPMEVQLRAAKERWDAADYPPTRFGRWLRVSDAELIASAPEDVPDSWMAL